MKSFIFSVLCIFFSSAAIQANDTVLKDTAGVAASNTEGMHEKFVPGVFMLEHITDKYEWHIITIGHTHVSIPLPIILYSKATGWHLFMSSKFHHGTESYQNLSIAAEGPNKGKILEKIGEAETLPFDVSITKVVFSLMLSTILLLWIFISVAMKYQRNPLKAPKGLQSVLEPMILFVRDDIAKPSIGEKKFEKFVPYLLTVFFFIWLNNMMGLVPIFPGGANVTGNIAVTLVMAVFTFAITSYQGNKHYWQEIYNAPGVPWWLKYPVPFMPLIELMGMFIKPIVLMVRLFANMTAGHLVTLSFIGLIFIFAEMNIWLGYGVSVVSTAFAVFMLLLEVLVCLIQAYVFTLLSAIYFGMAVHEPHKDHH